MNAKRIYDVIRGEAPLVASDVGDLALMVEAYPYFDAVKFLYLKSLYEFDIARFKGELSRLSVLLSNREALFYSIFRAEYAQYLKNTGRNTLEQGKTDKLLEAFFEEHEPDVGAFDYEVPFNNLATVDYLSYLEEEQKRGEKKEILAHKINEGQANMIFIEGDKVLSESEVELNPDVDMREPIEADSLPVVPYLEYDISDYNLDVELDDIDIIPLHHQDIIDRFLENAQKEKVSSFLLDKDKYKGDKDYPTEENKEEPTELGDDVFFTETLAKIYTKQGRYEKAYEIIEHLNLKYPKKNSYFADQLKYLEKLIINKKHKERK